MEAPCIRATAYPPEIEIFSLKAACGCPSARIVVVEVVVVAAAAAAAAVVVVLVVVM